jgi:hypothetical protein
MPAKKPLILPGWGSQTPAVQALVPRATKKRRKKTARKRPVRRRRAASTTRRKPARRATRRTKKAAYLVKGSPAAKRHMAKLRRMRGKK